ncbi:hypothetical protein V496_06602 [Pseudogymnoascus sp. VKM F-4515 (FW-2607)]|nr:hypothetical protein V496_06602 [Pseudogymnoascus sp. VKM F-4515 (FW-2607)]
MLLSHLSLVKISTHHSPRSHSSRQNWLQWLSPRVVSIPSRSSNLRVRSSNGCAICATPDLTGSFSSANIASSRPAEPAPTSARRSGNIAQIVCARTMRASVSAPRRHESTCFAQLSALDIHLLQRSPGVRKKFGLSFMFRDGGKDGGKDGVGALFSDCSGFLCFGSGVWEASMA